jgi:hypothetical protein
LSFDIAFALIDVFICADPPVTFIYRLRQGGGPSIFFLEASSTDT